MKDILLLQRHRKQQLKKAELAESLKDARTYADRRRAANTRKAYATQWAQWVEWAKQAGVQVFPAPPEGVSLFLSWRARQGVSTSTLAVTFYAINFQHEQAGAENPCRHPAVRAVWDGIRRTKGTAPEKQAAPLEAPALARVLSAMPWGTTSVRDRALLLLGFIGGFRGGQLLDVKFEHLSFRPEGMAIRLLRGKTDQEGKGRVIYVTPGANRLTCPVTAVRDWLMIRGKEPGFLFVGTKGRHEPLGLREKRMSHAQLNNIIKARAKAAGLDPELLSGHSLRSGLVTAATGADVSDHRIMDQTGHKSPEMMRRYRRQKDQLTDDFSKKVGL